MLALVATLLVAAPPGPGSAKPAAAAPVAAIQLTLNNDGNYGPGGPVDVRVQSADDGYLLVFRVDGDGHVRVLFPLDPDQDAFVRGGKEYELRGRDEGQTFYADDRAGNGMVYAALAHEPFAVHDFSANGHWDYDALRLSDSSTDAENDLTSIVSQMTDRNRFDYDAVGYRVQDVGTVTAVSGGGYYPGFYDPYYNPAWRCLGCGWGYPGADLGFGLSFGYSPYYDPFLYSPWGYGYSGYGYGYFPGGYPIVVGHGRPNRPIPYGYGPRPRTRNIVAPSGNRAAVPPSSVGIRARPRPANMMVEPRRMSAQGGRPAFRQPPQANYAPGGRSRVDVRSAPPAYREPPPRERQSSPPPRSAPSARSAPSRGGGGGGGHHR